MAKAARQQWPIPLATQRKVIARVLEYLSPDGTPPDDGSAPKIHGARTVLRAAEVLALFGGLSLKQQALDLARERVLEPEIEGVPFSDLVGDAEKRARERETQRALPHSPGT